jgi:hypothetical protein
MHALKLLDPPLPLLELLDELPEEAGFVPHPTSTNPSATKPATTVIPRTRRKAVSSPTARKRSVPLQHLLRAPVDTGVIRETVPPVERFATTS